MSDWDDPSFKRNEIRGMRPFDGGKILRLQMSPLSLSPLKQAGCGDPRQMHSSRKLPLQPLQRARHRSVSLEYYNKDRPNCIETSSHRNCISICLYSNITIWHAHPYHASAPWAPTCMRTARVGAHMHGRGRGGRPPPHAAESLGYACRICALRRRRQQQRPRASKASRAGSEEGAPRRRPGCPATPPRLPWP